jgi:hypothetical protein
LTVAATRMFRAMTSTASTTIKGSGRRMSDFQKSGPWFGLADESGLGR